MTERSRQAPDVHSSAIPGEPATPELVDTQLAAVSRLVGAVDASLAIHKRRAGELRKAIAGGDTTAAKAIVDELATHVEACYQRLAEMGVTWNELAMRVTLKREGEP